MGFELKAAFCPQAEWQASLFLLRSVDPIFEKGVKKGLT
jgi:hypothetical protein